MLLILEVLLTFSLLLNPASKLIGVRHFCHVSLKMKAVNFHHSRLQISGFRSQQNKQADDTKDEYSEPFKTNIYEEPSLVNTTKGNFLLHISEEDSKQMSSQNNCEHNETKALEER